MKTDRRQILAASLLALAPSALSAGGAAAQAGPTPLVTEPISRFIAGFQGLTIEEPILELGRLHILDTLASTVACRDLEPAVLARNFALSQSGDARRNARRARSVEL